MEKNDVFEGLMLAKQAKVAIRNDFLKDNTEYYEIKDMIDHAVDQGCHWVIYEKPHLHSVIVKYLVALGYFIRQDNSGWLIAW